MKIPARPIVEHLEVGPSPDLLARVEERAERLGRDPRLAVEERFRPLLARAEEAGPSLLIEDISAIRIPPRPYRFDFVMDRSRLRAGSGDLVPTFRPPPAGYEEYCREYLGLGECRWLHPRPLEDSRRIARGCWEDPRVFEVLAGANREGRLRRIDPYMGTPDVWELAARIREEGGRPLQVVAPPPGLTLWVNDKVAFTETVRSLFGPEWVLPCTAAADLDGIREQVRLWSGRCGRVGLKTPDSAGGAGNFVLEASSGRHATRTDLEPTLRARAWRPGVPVLVGPWIDGPAGSPSVQIWIPARGRPIVEGVYQQWVRGEVGEFIGSHPADLPPETTRLLAERSWLLARLFQRLGYVGRCSFDTLLADGHDSPRILFVECNGRWGGTSMPMTLMNRLLGDCLRKPHVCGVLEHDAMANAEFGRLLELFAADLFDVRTGRGRLILFNPGRMWARSGIEAVVLGATQQEAAHTLQEELPDRLGRAFVESGR